MQANGDGAYRRGTEDAENGKSRATTATNFTAKNTKVTEDGVKVH